MFQNSLTAHNVWMYNWDVHSCWLHNSISLSSVFLDIFSCLSFVLYILFLRVGPINSNLFLPKNYFPHWLGLMLQQHDWWHTCDKGSWHIAFWQRCHGGMKKLMIFWWDVRNGSEDNARKSCKKEDCFRLQKALIF